MRGGPLSTSQSIAVTAAGVGSASDLGGTLGAIALLINTTLASNRGTASGSRRWGDYSHTCLDPANDMTLWRIQQFCGSTNSWGYQVTRLLAPPPATP